MIPDPSVAEIHESDFPASARVGGEETSPARLGTGEAFGATQLAEGPSPFRRFEADESGRNDG